MSQRYIRNIPSISEAQQRQLREKRVLIVGCGGLGGYLIENMLRLGVGSVRAVDFDVFAESNLNRQLLSTAENIGEKKVLAAKKRALEIDPQVNFEAYDCAFDESSADELLSGCNLVLDALDSAGDRIVLENCCAQRGISIVHGAVSGKLAQAAVVLPGSGLLSSIYANGSGESEKSTLAPTVQFCAAIQSSHALSLLLGEKSGLENKLLLADMESLSWDIIQI